MITIINRPQGPRVPSLEVLLDLSLNDVDMPSDELKAPHKECKTTKRKVGYLRHFGVEPPVDLGKFDVWPTYAASFIRRPREADVGDEAVPEREALPGQFSLSWGRKSNDFDQLLRILASR